MKLGGLGGSVGWAPGSILAQVMIPGLWDGVLHRALLTVKSLLGIFSLPLSLSLSVPPRLMLSYALPLKKKKKKKKKDVMKSTGWEFTYCQSLLCYKTPLQGKRITKEDVQQLWNKLILKKVGLIYIDREKGMIYPFKL